MARGGSVSFADVVSSPGALLGFDGSGRFGDFREVGVEGCVDSVGDIDTSTFDTSSDVVSVCAVKHGIRESGFPGLCVVAGGVARVTEDARFAEATSD